MKASAVSAILFACFVSTAAAGTWTDHFVQSPLASEWQGDRAYFQIKDGVLEGQSASPVAVSPLNRLELPVNSTECDIAVWVNVVAPNTRVCTKGAIIFRHTGTNGYIFALHEATQTIEIYRLGNGEMLFKQNATIELRKWYHLRVELRGSAMNFLVDGRQVAALIDSRDLNGTVGLAVQDAETVRFDDFTISGPNIAGNIDTTSLPEIKIITPPEPGSFAFRFLASPPYDYFIQSSSNPFLHNWETIQFYTAKIQSFEVEFSEPATNRNRFYRIEKVHCGCR